MGQKSSENRLNAIEKSKQNDLYRLLFALGIPHIGLKAAKLLAARFGSVDDIFRASEEEIASIDGFRRDHGAECAALFRSSEHCAPDRTSA